MGVVAVDAYMHWAVLRRLSAVRGRGELPKALQKLDVSFNDLALLADATVEARRLHVSSRPWVQAKNAVQKRLLRMTFQGSGELGEAMAMVGIKAGWTTTAEAMRLPTEEVMTRLDRIVARRNQIVHEGDLARQSRPQRVTLNPMRRTDVEDDLDFLERVLDALHGVMNARV